MIWKEGFVQFSWKPHCFHFLKRISGECDDFQNFDPQKCDLPKRAAHDLKRTFCTNFMESALFSLFEENFRPVWQFSPLWRSRMRFGQNVVRMISKEQNVLYNFHGKCTPKRFEKRVLYNFHEKRTVFPVSIPKKNVLTKAHFQASLTILTTLTLKNAICCLTKTHYLHFVQFSMKAHCFPHDDTLKCDLAKTCTIFMESALFSLFGENWGQCDAHKCDFAKTSWAWREKSVLYNFYGKRTVFPFWREFPASVTILRTLTLKNAIWAKRAAHDLKRAFCTIFMKSALFSLFGENLRPVWQFSPLWRSRVRFGQNVLRMTWKEGFVQFSWKAHCFPFLERIGASVTLTNAILPKRAGHVLKRTFCTIFMESALFSGFEENLRQV